MNLFKKSVPDNRIIDVDEMNFGLGSIIISYNTIAFRDNLSAFNMKDFNTMKDKIIKEVIEKNASINIDIKNLNIPNSAVIAIIFVAAKVAKLEYHKEVKIFFNSMLDWQVKLIKNVFKNSGPCSIEDVEGKVTLHSLINNYYSI